MNVPNLATQLQSTSQFRVPPARWSSVRAQEDLHNGRPNFYTETPRLYISYVLHTPAHSTFLVHLYNTPLFLASAGLTDVTTPETALGRIQEFHEWQAKYGYGQYIVSLKPHKTASLAESTPIGSVSLMRGKDEYSPTVPDIGYCTVPELNGKGLPPRLLGHC